MSKTLWYRIDKEIRPLSYRWRIWEVKPTLWLDPITGEPVHYRYGAPMYKQVWLKQGFTSSRRGAMRAIKRWAKRYGNPEIKEVGNGSSGKTEEDRRDSASDEATITIAGAKFAVKGGTIAFTGASEDLMEDMEANLKRPLPLPVEKSDMPILAHRSASLRFCGDGRPFGSVNDNLGTFGVDSQAKCHCPTFSYRGQYHFNAPAPDGDCGFYALPPDMEPTYPSGRYVTLQVELYGRVIVCENGYRAQFQRVIECQLPPCPYCNGKAEVLHVVDNVLHEATCRRHNWLFSDLDRVVPGRVVTLPSGSLWEDKSVRYIQLDVDDINLGVPVIRLGH